MKLAIQRSLAGLTGLLLMAIAPVAMAQGRPQLPDRTSYAQTAQGVTAGEQRTDTAQANQPEPAYAPPTGTHQPANGPVSGSGQEGTMVNGDEAAEGQCPVCGAPGAVGSCCAICGGGSCCPPLWSVEQGARLLIRSRPRDILITNVDQGRPLAPFFTTTLQEILSTRSNVYNLALGYDLTIDRYLGRDKAGRDDFFEFNYWGMNSWQDTQTVTGGNTFSVTSTANGTVTAFGNLDSGFQSGVGGFNRADIHSISIESTIHNFEWDIRFQPRGRPDRLVLQPNGVWQRQCQPGEYWSFLLGFHYLLLNESFKFHSGGLTDVFDQTTGALISSTPVSGDYNVYTHNNLLALMTGTDLTFRRCRTEWGFRAKFGPGVNIADQSSDVVSHAAGIDPFALTDLDRHTKANANALAFVGEVGIFASYRLRPNLIAHAGYDLIWVNSLALGPEQITYELSPPSRVNVNGNVNYQGLTLQLEKTW